MNLPRLPVPVIVASGFIAVVALALCVIYFTRDLPTEAQLCERKCAEGKRAGRMVPVYPPGQLVGVRAQGDPPMKCECW